MLHHYRELEPPIKVPMTLLRHRQRLAPMPYITQQHYLAPCMEELMLRNKTQEPGLS